MQVIGNIKPVDEGPKWHSDTRIFLDKNGKVCSDKDPDKHVLLVAAGGSIPMSRAKELGLVAPAGTKIVIPREDAFETERKQWKVLEDEYLQTIEKLEREIEGLRSREEGESEPSDEGFHVAGVPTKVLEELAKIGVTSIEALKATSDETLVGVPGVNAKILAALKKAK